MPKIRCKLCGKEIITGDYCEECTKKRNDYLKNREEKENNKVIEQTNINNNINSNETKNLIARNPQNDQKIKQTKKTTNIIAVISIIISLIYIIIAIINYIYSGDGFTTLFSLASIIVIIFF